MTQGQNLNGTWPSTPTAKSRCPGGFQQEKWGNHALNRWVSAANYFMLCPGVYPWQGGHVWQQLGADAVFAAVSLLPSPDFIKFAMHFCWMEGISLRHDWWFQIHYLISQEISAHLNNYPGFHHFPKISTCFHAGISQEPPHFPMIFKCPTFWMTLTYFDSFGFIRNVPPNPLDYTVIIFPTKINHLKV